MLIRVLTVLALVAGGPTVWAQDNKTIDDQKFCPIMVKKEVNAESKVVEYQGIKIRMCCDVCAERFKKYPEAYLDEKFIPQLNGLKVPQRKIAQKFCPVYPDRVVTEKDPFVMYKEQKIYLFNKAAVKKWEKNPEKYAKLKLLPQLAAAGVKAEDESQSEPTKAEGENDSDAGGAADGDGDDKGGASH